MILVIVPVIAAALTAFTALGGAAAQSSQEPRFAAVPAEKGGQDIFGGYDVVPNWPKPLSSLPGPREMDLGRRPGRVCREPQPRVRSPARRTAEHPAADDDQAAAARTEHRIPEFPPALARCDRRQPSRGARTRRQGGRRL